MQNAVLTKLKKIADIIQQENFSSKFFNKISTSDAFQHPLNIPKIEKNLRGALGKDSIEEYLIRTRALKEYKVFDYIKKCFGNDSVNPGKEYRPLLFFVKSQEIFDEMDIMFDMLEEGVNKTIVHVGNRGSGKTITQNCWLYQNNKKLEEKNVFWVRCDGHKLYQLWLNYNKSDEFDENKHVTISEYFNLQILYVFVKYYDKEDRPLFKSIYEEIIKEDLKYYSLATSTGTKVDSKSFINGLAELKNSIKAEDGKHEGFSYIYDVIMKETQRNVNFYNKSRFLWLRMSEAFQSFLLGAGYKILKFIDGLDNIELSVPHSKDYYYRMLSQAYDLVCRNRDKNVLYFIAMRERTYEEFKNQYPIATDTQDYNSGLFKISHQVCCLCEIYTKRIQFLNQEKDFIALVKDAKSKFSEIITKILDY
ncbi:MAG: hypothetical protein IPN76_27380 [Saprospiraceae bacterium]|nr:hypothetical protein [Saprospiraceae bacterium]